jgi:hypothetical protein
LIQSYLYLRKKLSSREQALLYNLKQDGDFVEIRWSILKI